MKSFVVGIILLLLGYLLYSKIIERVLRIRPARRTPAIDHPDGVDYVPMKSWRTFLIQFLNIAGVGPICGAIMGAQFGTASFLWIVFGSIFAGAVHDFVSGFISLRHNGCSLPDIQGRYLGENVRKFMRYFTLFMLVLCGAVFVNTPAVILNANFTPNWNIYLWVAIVFAYYLIATLLPIDKLIGKIYPIFGFLLLAMAVAIVVVLFAHWDSTSQYIPEVWNRLHNEHPNAAHTPIFPMMFISIACGAISGFHATQSPLMARCMTDERQARPVFYGAMITEGIVALIWAAAATYFYHEPILAAKSAGLSGPAMVSMIANHWFTPVVAVVTVLGVVSAAITTGDTALRSARLIVADITQIDQKPMGKRLLTAMMVFIPTIIVLVFSLGDPKGFDVIWRYFAWGNQLLATITLWALSVFLYWKNPRQYNYLFTLIPALFMSMVTGCFLFVAENEGLGTLIPHWLGYSIGAVITLVMLVLFLRWKHAHPARN